MNALFAKLQTLPRSAQWLIYLGVFVIVFLGIIKPALSYSDKVEADASRLESALSRRADFISPGASDAGLITSSQAVFGTPVKPFAGGNALKPEAFSRIVNTILEKNKVTASTNERPPVRLSGDAATALGVPVNRIIIEITFEATPEVVSAVLADLERAPEVATVSRVKIDRSSVRGGANEDDRLVRATLAPEAWVAASGAGGFSSGDSGPGVTQ